MEAKIRPKVSPGKCTEYGWWLVTCQWVASGWCISWGLQFCWSDVVASCNLYFTIGCRLLRPNPPPQAGSHTLRANHLVWSSSTQLIHSLTGQHNAAQQRGIGTGLLETWLSRDRDAVHWHWCRKARMTEWLPGGTALAPE